MVSAFIATLLLAQAATGTYSTTSVMEYASSTAVAMNLNKEHFLMVLKCESDFQWNAKGDDGISIGVAQINLQAHPEVFYVQALAPLWSIQWMAKQWQMNNAHLWSCWNILYGNN